METTHSNYTQDVFIQGPGAVSAWTCTCGDSSQFGLRGINQALRSAALHAQQHEMVEWSDEDDERLDALAAVAANAVREIAKLSSCTLGEALEAVASELQS